MTAHAVARVAGAATQSHVATTAAARLQPGHPEVRLVNPGVPLHALPGVCCIPADVHHAVTACYWHVVWSILGNCIELNCCAVDEAKAAATPACLGPAAFMGQQD
jgi:hypothetical protein